MIVGLVVRTSNGPNKLAGDRRVSRGILGPSCFASNMICSWLIIVLFAVGTVCGEEPLDWDTWERLPVLEAGRRMPLDTFARSLVSTVCGRESPKLWLPAVADGDDSSAQKAAEVLFPQGKPRRFRASELVFSWLVEPQRWQSVPFLIAEHKQLREQVFGLPTHDAFGRLRFVSPNNVRSSQEFHRRVQALATERRQQDKGWEPVGVDRAIDRLDEAYGYFAEFTFDPRNSKVIPRRLRRHLDAIAVQLEQSAQLLRRNGRMTEGDPAARVLLRAGEAIDPLLSSGQSGDLSPERAEQLVVGVRRACAAWAEHCRAHESQRMVLFAEAAFHHAVEAHFAIYDPQITLRVVPGLNPAAFEPDRDPEDDFQPWTGFRALVFGSESLLQDYPADSVSRVRAAWGQVTAVYLDRGRSDRPAAFTAAMNELADALAELGRETTRHRDALPLVRRDSELLNQTAYPPQGFTDTEVFYNRLDPFFWSWLVNLVAVACLALSFGRQRGVMLLAGLVVLAAAAGVTTLGFVLRMAIMRLVPLTNMFETVAFVGLSVPLLGAWFTLLPMIWPGLRQAWALTDARLLWRPDLFSTAAAQGALGSTASAGEASQVGVETEAVKLWALGAAAASVLLRLALLWPIYAFTTRYISPTLEWADRSWGERAGEIGVWLVAVAVVAAAVYFGSRVVPVLLLALITVPRQAVRLGWRTLWSQSLDRRVFALVGAAVGVLAALIAYYAPNTVIDKDISHVQPVLRDNFWLFVHVLTITASYAAGALAWGLANIALGYFLFGSYQPGPQGVAPPRPVSDLAQYAYKATQAAVLLLAAGTILGALWADKAWGHFWSWDAKEVWSLLTLLAYMAVLHARHVGWVGPFGMAFGSVLGATFILIAWYGVNFLLPAGKHSYGSGGAGGQWFVGGFLLLNWLFLAAASVRYHIAIHRPSQSSNADLKQRPEAG